MKENLEKIRKLPPSLNSTFSPEDVSVGLTRCGLLVNRAEKISRLYAEHLDWSKTKQIWHKSRLGNRGSRSSSQIIFHHLKSRFQSAGSELPPIKQLPTIFDRCQGHRSKAQILYFYLLEGDALFRFIVHECIRRLFSSVDNDLNFEQDFLNYLFKKFRFTDGSPLSYSESTLNRWGRGFRSVMRKIGVLKSSQAVSGAPPPVDDMSLFVSAGYSWRREGDTWLSFPIGWMYLFQPPGKWDSLVKRVEKFNNWTLRETVGEVRLEPLNDPFHIDRIEE